VVPADGEPTAKSVLISKVWSFISRDENGTLIDGSDAKRERVTTIVFEPNGRVMTYTNNVPHFSGWTWQEAGGGKVKVTSKSRHRLFEFDKDWVRLSGLDFSNIPGEFVAYVPEAERAKSAPPVAAAAPAPALAQTGLAAILTRQPWTWGRWYAGRTSQRAAETLRFEPDGRLVPYHNSVPYEEAWTWSVVSEKEVRVTLTKEKKSRIWRINAAGDSLLGQDFGNVQIEARAVKP